MTRKKLIIVVFWIGVWQCVSMLAKDSIFFTSPIAVIRSLIHQAAALNFWESIATSMGKIGLGFLAAFLLGIIIGILSYRFKPIGYLLEPIILLMKSVPVASFVILALIWMGSKNLSIFIAFTIVFPVIYTNTISGLRSTDIKLLEMAEVFSMGFWYKAIAVYKPALMPYLISSCKVALGMAWKSGIAAEVIGVPDMSIGERLYTSKIFLDTPGLFAWTLVIILLSALTEKLVLYALKSLDRAYPFDAIKQSKQKIKRCSWTQPAVSGLAKSYGNKVIFSDYTREFKADGIYCLMGPSGRGKTTLLHIICGIIVPDRGSIGDFSLKKFGVVFQEDRLQERLSSINNVKIASDGSYSKEAIAKGLLRLLPEECINKPVNQLSGGMKRRTCICRAVMSDSDVLIMDEPFAGLDRQAKLKAIEYIKENRNGRLLIVSTHNEEDVDLLEAEKLII